MLDEPRELLARALFPLKPLEPPLMALDLAPVLLLGMSRLPIWSAPPRLPVLVEGRLPAPAPG
jgi:hypothetical protein